MSKEIEEVFEMMFEYTKNNTEMIDSYTYDNQDDQFKLSMLTGTMIACTTSIIQMLSLIYEKLEGKENEK
jgi:hypothetical protein